MQDQIPDSDGKVLYPEHHKLQVLGDYTQAVGDFITWLRDNKMVIGTFINDVFIPDTRSINHWIADHFKIDIQAYQAEKKLIMAKIMEMNKANDQSSDSNNQKSE